MPNFKGLESSIGTKGKKNKSIHTDFQAEEFQTMENQPSLCLSFGKDHNMTKT